MRNERLVAARRVLFTALASLALGVGCDDEEQRAKVEEAVLVGASGHFFADRGELRIGVSPKDLDGNFVGHGLPKSAFSFENVTMVPLDGQGAPVEVTAQVTQVDSVEADPDAALRAVVLFDSSGSMSSNDPDAMGRKLGGTALFDVLGPEDQLAVLDFGAGSTDPLTETRVLQDFTNDRALLDASLEQLTESGGTPLYQSILEALDVLAAQADKRLPVLVVLTDGEATDSRNFQDAVDSAQAKQVPIYAIGLGDRLDFSELTELTEKTGGAFIESSDAVGLERAFAGVSSGFRLGSVTVMGEGMYTLPAGGPTRYRVSGNLITDAEPVDITTPFTFTVDIEEAPGEDAREDDDTSGDIWDNVTVGGG